MIPALPLFGYAVAAAWWTPPLLSRLTARGISPRLGLAAWLTAMASVVAAATAGLSFLAAAAVAGWPGLVEAVCRSVAGQACGPTIYRGAALELGLGAAAVLAAAAAAVAGWRYGRSVQRAQQRTRAHGEAARITGMPGTRAERALLAGVPAGTVVLDAPAPAAYCLPPATIVLTTAALAILDAPQLEAVLAHERAHLAGHHHLLAGLTRGLSAAFPAVPLFTRGPREVARLAELRADDAAARRSGVRALVAALLAMGTGAAVPASALGATGGAVAARVQRLLEPPRRARAARCALALAAVTAALALAPALVAAS
jgi:Zn-dependent protease with chaperone function